jgi:hypothetical protein
MLNELMDDRDLYRMVDEIFHYFWDPIGVAGEARALKVVRLLIE